MLVLQEKAFEHQRLRQTLKAFGFSPGFIAKIEAFNCDIASIQKVNGALDAPFVVQRGHSRNALFLGCCIPSPLNFCFTN